MPGEPLHLCTQNHQPFFYTGETCPYCAQREQLEAAGTRIAQLEQQRRSVEQWIDRVQQPTAPVQEP
jgi:hypothetical protein